MTHAVAVRLEPIRAWRIWRVADDEMLESPIYGDRWTPCVSSRPNVPTIRCPRLRAAAVSTQ